jgi:predicted transcriptional regulator
VLRIEVRFMTKICAPTAQQVDQLRQDGPKQLAEIAQELRRKLAIVRSDISALKRSGTVSDNDWNSGKAQPVP